MAKMNTTADTGQAPPTEEQPQEHLLIYDREKALLQALSKVEKDGKIKTVPADDKHNNQFLKLNGSENWLESFASNFQNQFKDPTKFGLIRLKASDLEDPLVKKAMQDMAEGKITKEVVAFLEKYEVKPQDLKNINPKNTEKMAKQENKAPTEELQPQRYRYNEAMVDWNQVNAHGITREILEQKGLLDALMNKQKSPDLVQITANIAGTETRYQARISFRQEDDGRVVLQTYPLRQQPDFTRSFMGHNFSEDDKVNLLNIDPEKNSGHNMGRVVPLRQRNGEWVDSLISIDKVTNQFSATAVNSVFIPDEVSGVKLSEQEKADLREGKQIYVEGMTSKKGTDFNAHLQINADQRRVEYLFPKQNKLQYGQELGKVKLTNGQVDDLNSGKTIFVENMVSKRGEQFSSFIKQDSVSGRLSYSRINPDNPSEIYVPNEINGVKITPEERQALREGKEIYLNDMVSARGETFSSYVKLDEATAYPRYSSTKEGFSESRGPKIPAEVFGVKLSATQRANLQDGKAVLIEGMKGFNGQEFSQWAKVNQSGTKLNYFNENPDVKKDTTQRNVNAPTVKQDAETKKDAKKSKGQSL